MKQPRLPTEPNNQNESPEFATEVGYGRPPFHSRFKPGQSGNRKGRPKGRRNVRTVVERALNQRITVREGGRTRVLTKLEGLVLTMVNKGVQGDAKAQSVLIALFRALGMTADMPPETNMEPVTANDADILEDFLRRQGDSPESIAASEDAGQSPTNKRIES
jgi:hypothetical protein